MEEQVFPILNSFSSSSSTSSSEGSMDLSSEEEINLPDFTSRQKSLSTASITEKNGLECGNFSLADEKIALSEVTNDVTRESFNLNFSSSSSSTSSSSEQD